MTKLTHGAVPPIPVSSEAMTVRIGVTGHRKLNHPERVTSSLTEVMKRLDELFTCEHRYKVLSALAEGADRLVAQFILAWHVTGCEVENCQPALDVLLPMPEAIFFATFDKSQRGAAIAGYQKLRSSAQVVSVQPAAPSENEEEQRIFYGDSARHKEAYLKNGQILADRSQILIAIWNGRKAAGKGGTADIVSYARSRGYSVIHIHSESGKITWPHHGDDYFSQLRNLEEYNQEEVDRESVAQRVDERFAKLTKQAKDAGLSEHILMPLTKGILPHWEKATRLAAHNRSLYLWTGTIGYLLAACAVFVAASFSLAPIKHEAWFGIEAGIIAVVGAIGISLKTCGWQRKWIDYRYLAERLRAACFLHVAELPLQAPEPYPDHKVPWLPDGWISIAQKELWKTVQPATALLPVNFKDESPAHTRSLASFLLEGWIVSQQKFYAKSSHKNHASNERNEIVLYILLATTLLIATGHAFFGEVIAEHSHRVAISMSILAVTLPAFASAIAGITVHWHFHRNYERYSSMSHFTGLMASEIRAAAGIPTNAPKAVPDPELLRSRLREADRAMAHEHEGWRTVFGVRLPGPG